MARTKDPKYVCDAPCQTWSQVFVNTDSNGQYNPFHMRAKRWSVTTEYQSERSCTREGHECNKVIVSIENVQRDDQGSYYIGTESMGADTLGQFDIKILPGCSDKSKCPDSNSWGEHFSSSLKMGFPNVNVDTEVTPLPLDGPNLDIIQRFQKEDAVAYKTGHTDDNRWLRWAEYTARQHSHDDCYVCATARPTLVTTPFPLNSTNSEYGLQCLLTLDTTPDDTSKDVCADIRLLFPSPKQPSQPPPCKFAKGNYECFTAHRSDESAIRGRFPYCESTWTMFENGTVTFVGNNSSAVMSSPFRPSLNLFNPDARPRADVWWACGSKERMVQTLPRNWTGTCTPVMIILPITIGRLKSPIEAPNSDQRHGGRVKRDAPLGSFDKNIRLDSIGVPRGIPDEFKARNQIAAGFESIVLWPTINKNVDWINYIYYNQQRFVNHTLTALKGLAEQLDATSLMAWQNRMALDMLLADRGGVCVMFGDACCTFIPNNTAPDGSVTKALEGLRSLRDELAGNSGVDTSITGWFDSMFGKWRTEMASLLVSLATVIAFLLLCGCCIIPCARGLVTRSIDKAVSHTLAQIAMQSHAPEYTPPFQDEEYICV